MDMKSTLCLRYSPLPASLLLHLPSALRAQRATKPHLSLHHCSLSLSNGSMHRPLRHVLSPTICMFNGFSRPPKNNNEGDNNKVRGAMGASLVLACVLGIIGGNCRMNPKAIASAAANGRPGSQMTTTGVAPSKISAIGRRDALNSLLEVTTYLASRKAEPQKGWFPRQPPPSPPLSIGPRLTDVNAIKEEAKRLAKYGKDSQAAVTYLKEILKKCDTHDPQSAPIVEMALVEILISQGNYEDALACKCLQETKGANSDGRVHLYKAIIYTMLDKKACATKSWKNFIHLDDLPRDGPSGPGMQLYIPS